MGNLRAAAEALRLGGSNAIHGFCRNRRSRANGGSPIRWRLTGTPRPIMKFMSDGRILALGNTGASTIATQFFTFSATDVTGLSINDTLYCHNSVNYQLIAFSGSDKLYGLSGQRLF